ncbi:MAG: rRNA maturation RNase YbeY [Chitinophagales bacterium]
MKEVIFYNQHSQFNFSNDLIYAKGLLCVLNKELKLKEISINVVLLSDDGLLQINKEYLNHDYYTDIITFPLEQNNEVLEAELYISIDRIEDNAKTNSVDFLVEFKRVLVHGVLHLCGYNDKTNEEIKTMRQKEDYYLSSECFT